MLWLAIMSKYSVYMDEVKQLIRAHPYLVSALIGGGTVGGASVLLNKRKDKKKYENLYYALAGAGGGLAAAGAIDGTNKLMDYMRGPRGDVANLAKDVAKNVTVNAVKAGPIEGPKKVVSLINSIKDMRDNKLPALDKHLKVQEAGIRNYYKANPIPEELINKFKDYLLKRGPHASQV